MILTITPNPALDLTYEVDSVAVHDEHRVRRVRTAAGGKGINVARVLAQLGRPVTCAGLLGGADGHRVRELLAASDGIRQAWTKTSGATRRTVTIVDPSGVTGFNEPGPDLSTDEFITLQEDLAVQLSALDPMVEAIAISGSLPRGIGPEQVAALVQTCRAYERPVLVDTSGPALRAAARAGATALKPNAAEALAATGADSALRAAVTLIEDGAQIVICSLGGDGIIGVSRAGPVVRAWQAGIPEPLRGNPTGAGDSVVAVLTARLLVDGDPLPDVLRNAVAVAASAVTRPIAGEIDPPLAKRLLPSVAIQEIPCP